MDQISKLLLKHIPQLSTEHVPLLRGRGRCSCNDIKSSRKMPAFDESLRDGFGIRGEGEPKDGVFRFPVVSEIPAGDRRTIELKESCAVRIFTGAPVPEGVTRIVEQESAKDLGDYVEIDQAALQRSKTFIRRSGTLRERGVVLARKGFFLSSHQIAQIASDGRDSVEVYKRPRVTVVSTGSELVDVGKVAAKGEKVGTNALFLGLRLPVYGADMVSCGFAADLPGVLSSHFENGVRDRIDLLVTTGGLGPGKYDLVAEEFTRAGGVIHCRSLPISPGKSIIVGSLGALLVVSLPGPPSAVEILSEVLLGPILLALQGCPNPWPLHTEAHLLDEIRLTRSVTIERMEMARYFYHSGDWCVQLCRKPDDVGNCLLRLEKGDGSYKVGDRMKIYPVPVDCA